MSLAKLGIKDESIRFFTVRELIETDWLHKPLDGNHGEIHPKSEDFVVSGIPFVMASDIVDGRVDYTQCNHITRKQADSLRKGFAHNGDVLLTHKATIGRTAVVNYAEQSYIMLTPQVTYYRVKNSREINNKYLRYFFDFQFFQDTIQLWAGAGSTRAYLGITEQQKLPILLPEIKRQEKIASILSAYDDLIENNRRRIELLEKMAEELYREWFVRFRFPGYQQAKFHKGLPAEWELKKLKDILELCYGKALKEDQRHPGGFPVYGSSGVVGFHNKALVDGPGIIVGRKGNVGSIHWSGASFFPIDTVYFVKTKISLHYAFFMLNGLNFINNDSAVPGLNREQAYSNPVLLPSAPLIEKFEEIVISYFAEKQHLFKKNEILSGMRNQLLSRLISGKLPVDQLDIQFPPSMREAAAARQEVAHA